MSLTTGCCPEPMFHLNRKTEYGLLALHYLSLRPAGKRSSVRTIAEHYWIPEMVLAKVLQRLKHGGLVRSRKGSGGGYELSRSTQEISFTDVLRLFDESLDLVECLPNISHSECRQNTQCDIQRPLEVLNRAIIRHLDDLSLHVFFTSGVATPVESLSLDAETIPGRIRPPSPADAGRS